MKVNLGCGRFALRDYVNVDNRDLPNVDLVTDLEEQWPWHDGSVDVVRASHILEHVENPLHFIREAHRVLRPGGVLDITVPHWQHMNAWTDPTHRRAFTPHSLEFWTGNPQYEQYGPTFEARAVVPSKDEIRFILVRGSA